MSAPRTRGRAPLAVGVAGAVAVLGAGVLWLLLAPVQQEVAYPPSQQAPDGQALSLPLESYYRFGSVAVFLLLALVVGLVMGVAAWQLRTARGAAVAVALAVGTGAGSAIALLVGRLVRGGVADPAAVAAQVTVPTLVTRTVEVSWWAVTVAPAAALVVYTVAAAWHGDPDLGRPAGSSAPAAAEPVTAPIPVAGTSGPGEQQAAPPWPVTPGDAAPRTDP